MNKYLLKILVTLFFLVSLPSQAEVYGSLNSYKTPNTAKRIFNNQPIQNGLKSVLGNQYEAFITNFDVIGKPKIVDHGGLFVEGWLEDLYLYQAAAFVIYPDGMIYAAYVRPKDGDPIHYFTNASSPETLPSELKKWGARFFPYHNFEEGLVGPYNHLSKYTEPRALLSDQAINKGVQNILGAQYEVFINNFDAFSPPQELKDNGIFIYSWNKNRRPKKASAVIIHPDGQIYTAYTLAGEKHINYCTNITTQTTPPPEFIKWKKKYFPKRTIQKCIFITD